MLFKARYTAPYPARSNALPQLAAYPHLVSTYTKDFLHEGGTLPNASKLFFRKMENFFSIRKCINKKNGKVHLPQCKAKLFFTVIFQISVWIMPIIPLKSLQMILELFRNKLPSNDQENGIQLTENTASSLHEDFVRSRF